MRDLQLIAILAQVLGLLALLLVWFVADPTYHYDKVWLGGLCCLIAAGLAGIFFLKTLNSIFIFNMATVAMLAELFFRLSAASPLATTWCLLASVVFSLAMAPIFVNMLHYATALVVVGLLLGRGHWPRLSPTQDIGWSWIFIATVAVLGIFLNWAYVNLRRAAFRQRQRLETMAYQDALTGLDNRRSLMERMRALQAAGRLQSSHFLMIDIDDFKQINDRFGHDHGDMVLQSLAAALGAQAAPHQAMRLGGEEFSVLVENGDRGTATALAQRLLAAAHALARHPPGAAPELRARLTISIGVASGQPDDQVSDLLRRADQALYAAKRAGKDCVMADSDAMAASATDSQSPLPDTGNGNARP